MNSRITLALIVGFSIMTVGLTVLPTSIQEAQANPCANEISRGGSADNAFIPQDDDERECDFTGYFDFEEEIGSEDIPPPAIPFTIVGSLGGAITTCENQNLPSRMSIDAAGGESGTVRGTVTLDEAIVVFTLPITGGTTDGNTFSLSGEDGRCNGGTFTVSGNCGTDVTVNYEEDDALGTFSGDVECTLAQLA